MHRAHALFLVPAIALGLGACSLRKKPVAAAPPAPKPAASSTPTPPPEPLSAPQTSVQLPPPQPLSAEAIHSMEPPETTPAPPPTPRPRPPNRGPSQQRPVETPLPPVIAPPVSAEPERPPLQEQLPPTETKRLQEEAASRKAQARHLVDQAKRRRLSRQENGLVERINSFIKNSEDAEKRGDIRQASELAERALVLAQGLKP